MGLASAGLAAAFWAFALPSTSGTVRARSLMLPAKASGSRFVTGLHKTRQFLDRVFGRLVQFYFALQLVTLGD